MILLFWPAGALIYALARLFSDFCEHVLSGGLYRALQALISTVTGFLPFSLAELVLVLLIPAILATIIVFTFKMIRCGQPKPYTDGTVRGRKHIAIRAGLKLVGTLGIIFFSFVVLCGMNYFRQGIAESFGIEASGENKELLKDMCIDYAVKASQTRERLGDTSVLCFEDEQGVLRLSCSDR
ncbi:MAG: DUF3810 family protein [Lachnospiraceae bacterium]|nr:DUF3810 family protein [Lachnospiraceae bacterium]